MTQRFLADPLQMPPPYWRSGGSILQAKLALGELLHLLASLVSVNASTHAKLTAKWDSSDASESNDDLFSEVCEPLWELESHVNMKCDLVALMLAVALEDFVNMVSVFNLPIDLAESIERLSLAEKFLVVATFLGSPSAERTAATSCVRGISKWRNAYAHGHCTDRPAKTLRQNHLIRPNEYWSVPRQVKLVLTTFRNFQATTQLLRSISKNDYTRGSDADSEEAAVLVEQIKLFRFSHGKDSEWYSLRVEVPGRGYA